MSAALHKAYEFVYRSITRRYLLGHVVRNESDPKVMTKYRISADLSRLGVNSDKTTKSDLRRFELLGLVARNGKTVPLTVTSLGRELHRVLVAEGRLSEKGVPTVAVLRPGEDLVRAELEDLRVAIEGLYRLRGQAVLSPDIAKALAETTDRTSWHNISNWAEYCFLSGEHRAARMLTKFARAADDFPAENREAQKRTLLRLGNIADYLKDEDPIPYFENAKQFDPNDPDVLAAIAYQYVKKADSRAEQAVVDVIRVLNPTSDNAVSLGMQLVYGTLLADNGRKSEAIRQLRAVERKAAATARWSELANSLVQRARFLDNKPRYQFALLRKAVRAAKKTRDHNVLAEAYLGIGRHYVTIQCFAWAIKVADLAKAHAVLALNWEVYTQTYFLQGMSHLVKGPTFDPGRAQRRLFFASFLHVLYRSGPVILIDKFVSLTVRLGAICFARNERARAVLYAGQLDLIHSHLITRAMKEDRERFVEALEKARIHENSQMRKDIDFFVRLVFSPAAKDAAQFEQMELYRRFFKIPRSTVLPSFKSNYVGKL